MLRPLIASLFSLVLATPALAARAVGDSAPDFTAPASLAGKSFTFSLQAARQKGPVVVYFFPAAFTRGCNIQAHEFAVNNERFVAAGATVIGVSLDGIERLNAFSADPEYCGGKVPVASDADGGIARSYDLRIGEAPAGATDTRGETIGHGLAERTTFIVAPDGRIAATIGDLAPAANVAKALETVQQLTAGAARRP